MLIINGVEVVEVLQPKVSTFTDDHTVTFNEVDYTMIMNSSSNKTFTLPAPNASYIGKRFGFANINTGRLTIAVTGAGVVLNGGTAATGTMYCDVDATATLVIELTSLTQWSVVSANETWTTT